MYNVTTMGTKKLLIAVSTWVLNLCTCAYKYVPIMRMIKDIGT